MVMMTMIADVDVDDDDNDDGMAMIVETSESIKARLSVHPSVRPSLPGLLLTLLARMKIFPTTQHNEHPTNDPLLHSSSTLLSLLSSLFFKKIPKMFSAFDNFYVRLNIAREMSEEKKEREEDIVMRIGCKNEKDKSLEERRWTTFFSFIYWVEVMEG
ncbi:unnamed protein product [Thelazia callipaeda]|uniref:Transmembrane protein n=1 Tax=Thelazia callipaeda TaxID=103827 RepID=A0A0N5D6P0_THECL|nr:unnamed protein product [Thelazia callipaeda]